MVAWQRDGRRCHCLRLFDYGGGDAVEIGGDPRLRWFQVDVFKGKDRPVIVVKRAKEMWRWDRWRQGRRDQSLGPVRRRFHWPDVGVYRFDEDPAAVGER